MIFDLLEAVVGTVEGAVKIVQNVQRKKNVNEVVDDFVQSLNNANYRPDMFERIVVSNAAQNVTVIFLNGEEVKYSFEKHGFWLECQAVGELAWSLAKRFDLTHIDDDFIESHILIPTRIIEEEKRKQKERMSKLKKI